MFVDEHLDSVTLKSEWKKERTYAEHQCQTELELSTGEKASQSIKMKSKEIQTDEVIEEQIEICEDDSPEFLRFLRRAEPLVSDALKRNLLSKAFDDWEVSWEDGNSTVTNLHTLRHVADQDMDEQLQVTGVGWNCTGAVIGAALGRFDHEDWCTHKSTLCTWNINRRGLDPDKANVVIDVPSCLMCIHFHPQKPSYVVGGTFNGEVIVWDTSLAEDDDPVVYSSGIGDDSHRDPVSKVQWVQDAEATGLKYDVMSVSSDGRMLIWKLHPKKPILVLASGHVLLTDSLPHDLRVKAKSDQEMGVTCMSVANEQYRTTGTFLIGSESGGIFKCSTNSKGNVARQDVQCSVTLHSPVTFSYARHYGPVYSVENSPYHRNIFLSCGTDNSIRLYSMLQAVPLLEIEAGEGYLYSARWSPIRPTVFAVATETGKLLMYDLKRSKTTPSIAIEANDRNIPIFCMQFNQAREQLIATGDGMGFVHIWKLNNELSQMENREQEALEGIAHLAVDLEESEHLLEH